VRSLSVQQKRRFEAKGTHLERHGIDDRADDRKRITGATWSKTFPTERRATLKRPICTHLNQIMVALVGMRGSRGHVVCPHIPSHRFFSVGKTRSCPEVLWLYRKRPWKESWISLECAGAFDTAT